MRYYEDKYEEYIYAYVNNNRFHVIHEINNYYSDRNEELIQYRYAIIKFHVYNVGYIRTYEFFPYSGNYPNNFMPQNLA